MFNVHSSNNNNTSLVIGLLNSLFDVFTVTTLHFPSFPKSSSFILPISHFAGSRFSSFKISKSLIIRFFRSFLHFVLCCRLDKYSADHLFQKCGWSCWRCCHLFNLFTLTSVTSSSGNSLRGAAMRKCPGVSGCRSDGSDNIGVRGLEFKHTSIWHKTPRNLLKRQACVANNSAQMILDTFLASFPQTSKIASLLRDKVSFNLMLL